MIWINNKVEYVGKHGYVAAISKNIPKEGKGEGGGEYKLRPGRHDDSLLVSEEEEALLPVVRQLGQRPLQLAGRVRPAFLCQPGHNHGGTQMCQCRQPNANGRVPLLAHHRYMHSRPFLLPKPVVDPCLAGLRWRCARGRGRTEGRGAWWHWAESRTRLTQYNHSLFTCKLSDQFSRITSEARLGHSV